MGQDFMSMALGTQGSIESEARGDRAGRADAWGKRRGKRGAEQRGGRRGSRPGKLCHTVQCSWQPRLCCCVC